jgi:hypothetical protein
LGVLTAVAIFLVLLEANVATLRRAGRPMLTALLFGAIGTVAGVHSSVFCFCR